MGGAKGRGRGPLRSALCGILLVACAPAAAQEADDDRVARGEYVLHAAGCISCHTEDDDDAPFLAGGRPIASPFGTFYGPNITPDEETGIGDWTEGDLKRALKEGRGPDGKHYYPAFPYTSYTRMRDADIEALWAYLQTVEPVRKEDRDHDLDWFARFRPALRLWKMLHFQPGEFEPRESESDDWNRGAYLAKAMAHCAECHTPRTLTGGLDSDLLYAGNRLPDGDAAPNITQDEETGIGSWRGRHLIRYLDMGMDPDGDFAGSHMAEVIRDGTSHLTDEDRRALAIYIFSIEPIHHEVPEREE